MITGCLMPVEISNKLDRVQKDVGAIREALDDDRMQSLRAAIEGVHNALEARSPENKHALMTATIPELQKAMHQTIGALKREIAEIPSPKEWKVSRVFTDREPDMRSKLTKSEKTFRGMFGTHLNPKSGVFFDRRAGDWMWSGYSPLRRTPKGRNWGGRVQSTSPHAK